MYTMILSDKYENLLKEMCWDGAYLITGLKYQYIGNWNNNATHISTVVINVGMVDIHTL